MVSSPVGSMRGWIGRDTTGVTIPLLKLLFKGRGGRRRPWSLNARLCGPSRANIRFRIVPSWVEFIVKLAEF